MSDLTPGPDHRAAGDAHSDAVAPKVRTVIYLGSLILTFFAILILGALATFDVITKDQAVEMLAVIGTATGTLTPVLATVYRPTRPDALSN